MVNHLKKINPEEVGGPFSTAFMKIASIDEPSTALEIRGFIC
jgi:hypothetical protein